MGNSDYWSNLDNIVARAITHVRTAYGVREYTLPNGLRVLYRYESAAPVVAVCVTYHVGSRNEGPGHTGSTHILEHLLFKDSERFKKGESGVFSDAVEWKGAHFNATTWLDRTNYFELLPDTQLELALLGEADRMRGSLFTAADLASEMTVVRNEYERSRNNPFELLDEEMMATAFTKHPYRIPTIGYKEDIESSTVATLREFYDTFYWPNNATLMIVGNVRPAAVEKLVARHFGAVPRSPRIIPAMQTREPRQTAPRKVRLKKPMGVSIASLAYKVPAGTHADYPALLAAGTVLAGGFSSRLQRTLVDTGLAAELYVSEPALHDPGVAVFTAHVAHGALPEQVLKAMRQEIFQFRKQGATEEELSRAKERILAAVAAERDGVLNEARAVSEALAAGDWTLSYRLESEIAAVSLRDITRVARRYFISEGETSGLLLDK